MKSTGCSFMWRIAKIWRLIVVAVLAIGSIAIWGPMAPSAVTAAPGDELRIKNVKVSVWPEYDDPRVLVMYQGEFADGGTFPREVSFRAPKDASIQMACALTPKGEHQCQYYDTTYEGDYKIITFKLPIPTFWFEYYADGIEGATDKTINYQFANPPYSIDALDVEIQQPLKATGFAINPSTTSVASDAKGFKYYQYSLRNVAADKAVSYAVSYNKSDTNPSVQKQSEAATEGGQTNNSLIVIASVGGMGAILVASYWLSSKRNQQKRYAVRAVSAGRMRPAGRTTTPPRPATRPQAAPARSEAPNVTFCSNCGVRVDPGDVFCYSCGGTVKRKGDTDR